ncbi:hypothetical protein [Streptosporangium sp. CA-115845]|uniref:hypothetical protein n=1 Tax=Streptosporangium sp. CA-115845 TaxID=3240071 RepID=UPI003D8D4B80
MIVTGADGRVDASHRRRLADQRETVMGLLTILDEVEEKLGDADRCVNALLRSNGEGLSPTDYRDGVKELEAAHRAVRNVRRIGAALQTNLQPLIMDAVPWAGTIARCGVPARDGLVIICAGEDRPVGPPAELRDQDGALVGVVDNVWVDEQRRIRARGRVDASTPAGRVAAACIASVQHVTVQFDDARTRKHSDDGSGIREVVLLNGWRVTAVRLVGAGQAPWGEAVITAYLAPRPSGT